MMWLGNFIRSSNWLPIVYMGLSENSVPLNPMVLLIIIPMKNGYFIGNINPTFSDTPILSLGGYNRSSKWRLPLQPGNGSYNIGRNAQHTCLPALGRKNCCNPNHHPVVPEDVFPPSVFFYIAYVQCSENHVLHIFVWIFGWCTLWLFRIAMENQLVNHLFLWAIYTMAMLNKQRVPMKFPVGTPLKRDFPIRAPSYDGSAGELPRTIQN